MFGFLSYYLLLILKSEIRDEIKVNPRIISVNTLFCFGTSSSVILIFWFNFTDPRATASPRGDTSKTQVVKPDMRRSLRRVEQARKLQHVRPLQLQSDIGNPLIHFVFHVNKYYMVRERNKAIKWKWYYTSVITL